MSQWERGVQVPQEFYVQRLCDFYQMARAELGLDGLARYRPRNIIKKREQGKDQERESDQTVDRREAVKHIGSLGLTSFTISGLLGTQPLEQRLALLRLPSPREAAPEILHDFMVLTETCLYLSEGSQLEVAERVLWNYLPEVETTAQQSSKHQKLAASIASQGYLIAASLVGHHNDLQTRQRFSEQALHYGNLAQDRTLQVAAFRQLAVTFDYLGLPHEVLRAYEQTLPYLDEVAPLLRACIYAALSGVYAQLQQKQEASHFIGLAYEQVPAQGDNEPGILRLINARHHTVILWDGLNHLELNRPDMAEKTLAQLDVLKPKAHIPERIRIELLNYQAQAFAASGKKAQACDHLEQAFYAGIRIGSRRRLQESFTVFQYMREIWPHEQKIQGLGDLFFQHLIDRVY